MRTDEKSKRRGADREVTDFSALALSDDSNSMAGEKAGAVDKLGRRAGAQPRQQFVETAYWNPGVVTDKQGNFKKEFILAPTTGGGGSTGGVGFSTDKQQRLLFISDLVNNHIWFLNREDGKVVGQIGSMGQNGGQWFGLHMIAVDSKGNIYTGEVFNGERVQRFVPN